MLKSKVWKCLMWTHCITDKTKSDHWMHRSDVQNVLLDAFFMNWLFWNHQHLSSVSYVLDTVAGYSWILDAADSQWDRARSREYLSGEVYQHLDRDWQPWESLPVSGASRSASDTRRWNDGCPGGYTALGNTNSVTVHSGISWGCPWFSDRVPGWEMCEVQSDVRMYGGGGAVVKRYSDSGMHLCYSRRYVRCKLDVICEGNHGKKCDRSIGPGTLAGYTPRVNWRGRCPLYRGGSYPSNLG